MWPDRQARRYCPPLTGNARWVTYATASPDANRVEFVAHLGPRDADPPERRVDRQIVKDVNHGVALTVLGGRLCATRAKAEKSTIPTDGCLAAHPAKELGLDVDHTDWAGDHLSDLLRPMESRTGPR
jgi:hypothetical protein